MGVRRHGESALEGCLRSIQKAWRRRIPGKGRTQEVDRTWPRRQRACALPPRGPGGCWRRRADHAHRGHGRPGGGCDAAPGRGRRPGLAWPPWPRPPGLVPAARPWPAPAPSFWCSCWTRDGSERSIYRSASSAETRSPSTTAASYYDDPAATCLRGFLRDRNGRFTRIDFPTPAPPSCWTSTTAARSPAATGPPRAARTPTLTSTYAGARSKRDKPKSAPPSAILPLTLPSGSATFRPASAGCSRIRCSSS